MVWSLDCRLTNAAATTNRSWRQRLSLSAPRRTMTLPSRHAGTLSADHRFIAPRHLSPPDLWRPSLSAKAKILPAPKDDKMSSNGRGFLLYAF